ncbi:MAG: histidine kinase [Deltaproteobacteria bacterium]|nr:histidine kinase [Deltaproteobacteria bacterium]
MAPAVLGAVFLVNLLISVSIGASMWAVGRLALRVGATPPGAASGPGWLLRAATLVVGVLGGAYLGLAALEYLELPIARMFPFSAVVRVAFPVTLVIVGVSEALTRLQLRTREAEAARMRSELAALHARLNPHFLFNSLNTVAALIGEDPTRAEVAVVRLSELMRHTVVGAKAHWIALGDEVEATRSYLEFEALRYGPRLRFEVEVAPGLEQVRVPPLVLQPLVENAVNHGVGRREGGRVHVAVRAADGGLTLEVEDDGAGASPRVGTGTSQDDLRRRLDLAYEGRARLSVDQGRMGGYRVRVLVPLEGPR